MQGTKNENDEHSCKKIAYSHKCDQVALCDNTSSSSCTQSCARTRYSSRTYKVIQEDLQKKQAGNWSFPDSVVLEKFRVSYRKDQNVEYPILYDPDSFASKLVNDRYGKDEFTIWQPAAEKFPASTSIVQQNDIKAYYRYECNFDDEKSAKNKSRGWFTPNYDNDSTH